MQADPVRDPVRRRVPAPSPVLLRRDIASSWRRSRERGADRDGLGVGRVDVDADSAFVRAGAPVLLRAAGFLADTAASLALTDATGTVTWRRQSERALTRELDRAEFACGATATTRGRSSKTWVDLSRSGEA
ncbi:hypothetical protein [Amycolatopsis thermoflava]|uniref:Uncharacterized protein n=1 Tax=Amycolatopsis thermoflava TaxID=84480 RepID=A0A3N2G6U7_9PSEU|nr:hypothetical protein [Amycolatopsis thermoflava]ROS32130.1 hypothetical protein EDD35_7879 [Amycolatopsis thermoflava]